MAGTVLLIIAYVLSQFYRSFLAVLSPILTDELGMNATTLSWASGIWFIVFALAQFPIGKWLDMHGPRRTAGYILLIGGGGGAVAFALAGSGTMIILAMALIGLGCAPVLMASLYLFARTRPASSFATLTAMLVGFGSLGGVAGAEPLANAVLLWGWREVAWGLAAVTALTAIGILAVVRDPPQIETSQGRGSLKDLLAMRELWLIFPLVFMSYAVAAGIRGLWVGPYLSAVYGMSTAEIGRVALYMAIALAIGAAICGPLDRWFNTRKWIVVVANATVMAALAYLLLVPEKTIGEVTIAFVVIGLFGATYAVQMAHGKGFVPMHLTGRGVTLLNFFSIGGAGVLQFITGQVVALAGGGSDPAAYDALFQFYLAGLGITLLVYLFSRDMKP